jgi:hypothetical protein
VTKLKKDALIIAEDCTNDLLLIACDGRLYVQATPDGEPLAVFDAADVLTVLGAEQAGVQTRIVALAAIHDGHTVRCFGGRPAIAAAYTLRAAAEALAAARLLLPPDSGVATLAILLQNKLRVLFQTATTRRSRLVLPHDPDRLAQARAAVAISLAVAAEAEGRRLLSEALRQAGDALQRRPGKDAPC